MIATMKLFSLRSFAAALCLSAAIAPLHAQDNVANGATNPKPILTFNKKGQLVLVVTPDGHRCVYKYALDGNLAATEPPSCRDPQSWLNGNN